MITNRRSLILVLISVLTLITCVVDTEFAPCISSQNCPGNQYCSKTDNKCHNTKFIPYSCEEEDCSENEFCYPLDKTCHLADEVGLECNTNFDCPSGQLCKEEMCIIPEEPQCKESMDCIKENVERAACLDGVCRIEKCHLGFTDKDFDYSNGCENILPCSDDGFEPYDPCTGNNVCKCNSDCIMLSGYYGIEYNKGLCLEKCSPSDNNKTFGNMICSCTANEMGTCTKANLFETSMLTGIIKAKLLNSCDEFMKDSAVFSEITFTIGGKTSSYNRGTACKKIEDGKPVISISLFKICQLLPCQDIISINIPQNAQPNQTLRSDEAGAIKATIKYSMVDNQIKIQEIWFNAISGAGAIIVENNGNDTNKVIILNLNLKMVRYDVPFCGDMVKKSCNDI